MERFGALLQQSIKQLEISEARFSREHNINRGLLFYVLSGKKKLPEERLQAILHAKIFAPEINAQLREAYYREHYGLEAFERLLLIKQSLADMAAAPEFVPIPAHVTRWQPQRSVEVITNGGTLLAAVYYILSAELTRDNPAFDTNYPFTAKAIDDLVHALLHQHQGERVQMWHGATWQTNGRGTINLQNIFACLRWFGMGYQIYATANEFAPLLPADTLYPYFFITSGHALLFHPELNNGLLLSDTEVVQTLAFNASLLRPQYVPVCNFPANEFELGQMFGQKSLFHCAKGEMSYYPCLCGFVDREMLDALFHPDLEARTAFIDKVEELYQTLRSDPTAALFNTTKGYEEFAQTGKLQEMSKFVADPAPPEMRVTLLRRVRDAVLDGANIFLLDEKEIPIPTGISLELFGKFMFIAGSTAQGEDAFMGQYNKIVDRKTTVNDFSNFFEYIRRNQLVHSPKWTAAFLEELIDRIEG